jgi:Na+-driven multidrug efflux pump
LAPIMLGWMQTPADIMPYAVRYLRIYLAGGLPVIIYNMGRASCAASAIRAIHDLLSIGVILNIGLDLLFVRVFDWGVTGAACAYVAAQIVTAILVTASLMLSHEPFRLFLRDISFHRDILPDTMKVGIPAGLQAFVIALSNVFLQAVINGFGKHAVAGFSVATRVDGFVFMIISAIALAVMTFTGANVGARRYKRCAKGDIQGIALMVGIVIVVSGILLLLRYPSHEPSIRSNVVAYSTHIMIYILSLYWIFGITEVLAGSIRGLGQSVFPLGVTLVFMAGFRLLWIFSVVPVVQTFRVVVLAYPLSWTAALLAYLGVHLDQGWRGAESADTRRRGGRRRSGPTGRLRRRPDKFVGVILGGDGRFDPSIRSFQSIEGGKQLMEMNDRPDIADLSLDDALRSYRFFPLKYEEGKTGDIFCGVDLLPRIRVRT